MIELTREKLEAIWQEITDQLPLSKTNQPIGVVLGGQPGAGKSKVIEKFAAKLNANVIVINGDEYRKFHPNYTELQSKYGKDSVQYTAAFAGAVTEALLHKAIDNKLNIIIEGTFRTAETPMKTLGLLKNAGYETTAAVITCNKNLSYTSCQQRYERMLAANPATARFTPKEHHDLVTRVLQENCIKVAKSGLADKFYVFERKYDGKSYKCELVHHSGIHAISNLKLINKILGNTLEKHISR